ncbi:hypothetical protein [Mucilaginibacter oryzae]|uniref:hypothetical protein n=1 Tax=Mucilaginibacter oryzae TaxID=468058 RepID=UPI0011B1C61C|nr:hypothetical protein [Mucilaginibacter oryzae]
MTIAQHNTKDSVIRSFNDLKWSLRNYYNPIDDSVKNNCWQGCVFIRFKISRNQKLVNIAFTKHTPVFVAEAINRGIARINQRGLDIKKVRGETEKVYLLPFIIYNDDGCGFMTGWEDNNYKPDEKITMRQMTYHQSTNSIRNILNFTDEEELNLINCVLLAPVETPIVMY